MPAGVYDGSKLEMGVAGVAGLFAKYRYYFWYTPTTPHYLVRYYDTVTGSTTELLHHRARQVR